MNPIELSTLLLVIVGVILQLIFKYTPRVRQWYEMRENKGLWMLMFVCLTGIAYAALSCTPYAADLGIGVTCGKDTVFTLLKAIFFIANSQQLTYLMTRNSPKG